MKKLYIFLLAIAALNVANAQWVPQNSGTTHNLNSVYFTDASNGYAVGDSGTILKTTDGGSIWNSQVSGITERLNSVFFVNASNGYAVGDPHDVPPYGSIATILKTTDGGSSWYNSSIGTYGALNSVYFTDINIGYAVGVAVNGWVGWGITFKTTDGGFIWSAVFQEAGIDRYYSVSFTNPDTGYFVREMSGYGYSTAIQKTIDGGETWSVSGILTQSTERIRDVYFTDLNTGYSVGGSGAYGGIILKTIDGGANWSSHYLGSNIFTSVHFPDPNTGYIVGESGTILKTTDSGTTWVNQNSGSYNDLTTVYFTDENTGYVVGNSGTILKTTNGGGYPVGVNEKLSTPNSLKIYPTPTTDKITLETSVKGHLSILNLNGQELITRQITEPKTNLDISSLPSGIYFVRLMGERAVEVRKIIKW